MALKKTKKIFKLKDISVDSIVDAHVRRLKQPTVRNFNVNIYTGEEMGEVVESKFANVNKNKAILRDKFTYLIHLVITRSHSSEYGWAYLNSTALQKVFGKDYNQLINTLICKNIIYCTSFYVVDSLPYGYRLCNGIEYDFSLEYESYLSVYENKLKFSFEKAMRRRDKEAKVNFENDKLFGRYEQALSKLKLVYVDEANSFMALHPFLSGVSRDYYTYILERYSHKDDRHITSVDKNKRIYSILTATPRLLKPFLNILFSCDIHNSHPLLFNKLLCEHYSVPLDLLDRLYSLLEKSCSDVLNDVLDRPHYVRQFLRKALNINDEEKPIFANIPTDVWEYIIITSLGKFWDVIIPENDDAYNELLRSDIKVLLFSEVFYSKTMTTRRKYYAKMFKKRFPNVYKVVEVQKKGLRQSERTVLSNRMMALESQLFHEILTLLYNKRYKVVSIHDAIVVLDIQSNKSCTPEVVQGIIQKVYRKHGLYPNIATDIYGEAHMRQYMREEEELSVEAKEYRARLGIDAANGNKTASSILHDIDNGFRELCYDNNHHIIAHLVDPKLLKALSVSANYTAVNGHKQ